MGQKVNPHGFRLGNVFTWTSRWFANDKRYKQILFEDITLRQAIVRKLKSAGLSRVEIERSINKITIMLYVTRPGVVIGRGGTGLEQLKKFVTEFLSKGRKEGSSLKIEIRIEPVKEPSLDAQIVAANIAEQLVKRLPHRRVVKQAMDRVMTAGAKGIRITLSGRIGGAEIGRTETYKQGTVPLSTIREYIDYASNPALTKSGYVGVKVWICREEKKS